MKKIFLMLLILICIQSPCFSKPQKDTLYEVSTIEALMDGFYSNDYTFKELKRHGGFGLGTVDNLDGEMIALDGNFYQIKTDGKAYLIPGKMKTPFAMVIDFKSDKTLEINDTYTLEQLQNYLDQNLPTKNIYFGFEIKGKFKYMKTRSVPKQSKPYPLLTEVVKKQVVFEFNDVEGTIIGFRCPESAKGSNVVGYHLHFINKDKTAGGHVLDLKTDKIKADIDYLNRLELFLPTNYEFYQMNFSGGKEKDIEQVEKNKN